jgi:excisionase family DNA binding protein
MKTHAIPPLVSINEACRLLGGRGRGRIYELIAAGDLDSIVDGRRRLILGNSVSRYVEKLRESAEHVSPGDLV